MLHLKCWPPENILEAACSECLDFLLTYELCLIARIKPCPFEQVSVFYTRTLAKFGCHWRRNLSSHLPIYMYLLAVLIDTKYKLL